MRDVVKTYAVPFAVSGAGLMIALGLAVAPLLDRPSPKPTPAPVAAAPAPQPVAPASNPDQLARIEAVLAEQTRMLDNLGNRVAILEKGVSRLHGRLIDQRNALTGLDGLPGQVGKLEGEMRIVNTAIPRLHTKVQEQGRVVDDLAGVPGELRALEAELNVLNVAVPRVNGRIQTLRSQLKAILPD